MPSEGAVVDLDFDPDSESLPILTDSDRKLLAGELQFLRLLERTKKLTRGDLKTNVWKIAAGAKYLEALFADLDKLSNIDKDVIVQYGREIQQLKLIVKAERQDSSHEKLKVLDSIPTRFPDIPTVEAENDEESKTEVSHVHESYAGIRVRSKNYYKADLRRELLSSSRPQVDESVKNVTEHEDLQETLANELLGLTKELKQNMTVAGNVIREDNQRLGKMNQQVDSNKERLEVESTRLAHHAYKCGFDCMLIFVAVFIFWSFIVMVVVMKLFPKRVVA